MLRPSSSYSRITLPAVVGRKPTQSSLLRQQNCGLNFSSRSYCDFPKTTNTTTNTAIISSNNANRLNNPIKSAAQSQLQRNRRISSIVDDHKYKMSNQYQHFEIQLQRKKQCAPNAVRAKPAAAATTTTRMMSSEKDNNTTNAKSASNNNDGKNGTDGGEETATSEIVLTPGQKVVYATQMVFWIGAGVFSCVCAYYIGRELFPNKMSPNRVFDRSLDVVRNDPDVKKRYGDTIKGYGRDHGGHREGRRNFIEHTQYVDPDDDKDKRTRVRYNIEGRFGTAFVFAEMSSKMEAGEFVYILVQDKSNGRVHTVVDNRALITAKRLAGDNEQATGIMSQLLTGGNNNSSSDRR